MEQLKPPVPNRMRYLKLVLILLVIVAANIGGTWLAQQIDFQLYPRHEQIINILLLSFIGLYILLMALPFMPGIEIGLALMMVLGSKGAIIVYACTLLALSISFAIGKIVPCRMMYAVLNWFHFHKAAALVKQIEPMDQQQRLTFLYQYAPSRIIPFLLNHRYLTIAALLNLPGNALIGGGGGIGLIVGMSKIIPFYSYALLLAIAIAPVPLIIFLQG
ncbi:MAG: hypothetical protein V7739_10680 [Motiliproteus sp.]